MERLRQVGLIIVALFMLVMIAKGSIVEANNVQNYSLASDSKGYVTKCEYSYSNNSTPPIAIITGMHPREGLATNVVPEVIKEYARSHQVNIVNYQVNVTAYPENFYTGRNNGEYLVAKYVIPDIAKSKYALVIIAHDHEKGYGDDGFYYVTPSMDKKSIDLAEAVHSILPDFKYYQRDTTKKADSTSIERVDDPIVATGTPVFVYEMPEWSGYEEVFTKTDALMDSVFQVINFKSHKI